MIVGFGVLHIIVVLDIVLTGQLVQVVVALVLVLGILTCQVHVQELYM
jgi:hypothetical protein